MTRSDVLKPLGVWRWPGVLVTPTASGALGGCWAAPPPALSWKSPVFFCDFWLLFFGQKVVKEQE